MSGLTEFTLTPTWPGYRTRAAFKSADGSESGTLLTVNVSGAAIKNVLLCIVIGSDNAAIPMIANLAVSTTREINTARATPGIVTPVDGCMELSLIGLARGNDSPNIGVHTAPVPITKQVEASSSAASGSCSSALGVNLSPVQSATSIGPREWGLDQPALGGGYTVAISSTVSGLSESAKTQITP